MAFAAQVSPILTLKKKLLGPILRNWPDTLPTTKLKIHQDVLFHLAWWSLPRNLDHWSCFHRTATNLRIWTDACDSGWGGHTEDGSWVAGDWDPLHSGSHINVLEIRAVAMVLKSQLV